MVVDQRGQTFMHTTQCSISTKWWWLSYYEYYEQYFLRAKVILLPSLSFSLTKQVEIYNITYTFMAYIGVSATINITWVPLHIHNMNIFFLLWLNLSGYVQKGILAYRSTVYCKPINTLFRQSSLDIILTISNVLTICSH